MVDPWALIDAALEAGDPPITALDDERGQAIIDDVDIGDLAICYTGSRLPYIFYSFLASNGYVLTKQERKFWRILQSQQETVSKQIGRPCLVLERHHSPGSFKVCFLATFVKDFDSFVFDLSIPFGDQRTQGLITYPTFSKRKSHESDVPVEPRIFALPVVRSHLFPVRQAGNVRVRLHYGELEHARTLIKQKLELFAANHQKNRARELTLLYDPSNPAKKKKKDPLLPLAFELITQRNGNVNKMGFVRMHDSRFIPSRVTHYNDIRWILKHASQDIAATSRYLSSLENPPPPPFYLPRPYYSTLLRASAAFVRRRIFS
ncbi:hypothetical protein K438DRAFT_2007364 [Mycena galopus ATCC 62051]|nr:hypothetical protein K438DRAFT_2007364 [Mycena galopus ATCC 62051]